jgi:hypothetical protein
VVYAQDLAQPLEAFWGEFSLLAGFHFATVTEVPVMLAVPVILSEAKNLRSSPRSEAMFISD